MIKTTLLLCTLLTSTSLYAQIKTGGGPDVADDTTVNKVTGIFKTEAEVRELVTRLKQNDGKCSPNHNIKSDKDLFQTYLKLSMIKNTTQPASECEAASVYLNCVSDDETRGLARSLIANVATKKHLANTYHVPEIEINKMLIFFKNLGEKDKE
jgi:hypothetical protein